MVRCRSTLSLALAAGVVAAAPAAQSAAAAPSPVAQSAGSDAPPLSPSVVGVPITRTDKALSSAADFIDQADGARAAKPLTAARRYLIRSYSGARYLIALPPPAPAEEARAAAARYKKMARRVVRAAHRGGKAKSAWIRAHASDDGPALPAFADTPTAVFNVLTSQYAAATDAAGMYPDTTGTLQAKVKLVLNTSIILRNRLVKAISAAEPPAPAEEGRVRAHASQDEEGAPTFAPLMPGLTILIDDEVQQLKATMAQVPAAAAADLQAAINADQQVKGLVDSLWPAAPED
jgi:hypothetical protein